MRPPLAALGPLVLVSVALATGCRTRSPSPERPLVLRAGQSWDTRLLELDAADERRIQAHARFAAGVLDELSESPETALAHFLGAVEKDPDNEALTLDVARKLVARRRLEDARQLLERSAARPGATGLLLSWLGTVYSLQGNPAAAVKAHEEAIRRAPGNVRSYQALAQAHLDAGSPALAVEVLESAAARPDVDAAFLLVIAESLSVVQQRKDPGVGDLGGRVLVLLDRAASLKPERAQELLRLADLYQVQGEGEKALGIYQDLLEREPDLPGLRERLTGMYLRADEREKAAEQLRAMALSRPTNWLPHYMLGGLAMAERRFQDAVDAYARVLILRPDELQAYLDLAMAHLSLEQPAEALEVLGRARAAIRPARFEIEYFTAAALTEMQRYEEAVRHFTAAEVIGGASDPEKLTHLFFFQAGVASERAKRHEDAALLFEKAIALQPEFAEALNYLGYMWAEQGVHLERALGLIQRALELEPDSPAYLDSLAWVLHRMGRSAEALPHQERAVALSKEPDATLYDHLGDILAAIGRRDEARAAWQRAQEIEPKPEVAEKLRAEPVSGTPAESPGP